MQTGLLLGEMVGTFMLIFGTTILSYKIKTNEQISLMKFQLLFKAFAVAVILAMSVYVAMTIESTYVKATPQGGTTYIFGGHGFVNPAIAIMHAIAIESTEFLGMAIAGEMAGAIIGVILAKLILLGISKDAEEIKAIKSIYEPIDSINIRQDLIGEFGGSLFFIFGVSVAVFANAGFAFAGLFVGMAILGTIFILGDKVDMLLNPAAGIVTTITGILLNLDKSPKASLINLTTSITGNLTAAVAVGLTLKFMLNS